MKKCSKCDEEKSNIDFHKGANKCKSCVKQYKLDNKERISLRKKQWRLENKEKIKLKEKKYRVENKEKIVEYNKKYKDEIGNPFHLKERNIESPIEIKFQSIINHIVIIEEEKILYTSWRPA
jgi:hypothetical protein